LLRKSECNTSSSTDEPNIQQESLAVTDSVLRLSKSETNLIESFIIVDQDDLSLKTKPVSPLHRLRDGILRLLLLYYLFDKLLIYKEMYVSL
jgi:hypothetical protein